jgi:hypothetical protein
MRAVDQLPNLCSLRADRKALRAAVVLGVHTLTGVKPEFGKVIEIAKPTPFGPTIGYSTVDLAFRITLYKYVMCRHCTALRNLKIRNGLIVEYFCKSCRIKFSSLTPKLCPNPLKNKKCRGSTWINPLGGSSLLCSECNSQRPEH